MVEVTARLLTEKANKHCREEKDMYFHHTFNPDWYYNYVTGAFWIDSAYGFKLSEEKQRELLSHALDGLTEGIDYNLEVK